MTIFVSVIGESSSKTKHTGSRYFTGEMPISDNILMNTVNGDVTAQCLGNSGMIFEKIAT